MINLEINGYKCDHVYGQKSRGVRKGRQSGGITVYFREELSDKISIVEKHDFGKMWIKISNELFHFNEDVYLCYIYIPPTNSKVLKDKDINFFDEIEKGLEKFDKLGKTYITGDFNSRTATLSDILDLDVYDENDFQIILTLSSLPERQKQDHVTDINGQRLITLCKSTSHIIANGRLLNDRLGNFTFCSTRGLSVTDYLLLNIFDIDSINNFEILNWNSFSDHAALHFTFLKKRLRIVSEHKMKISRSKKS